jgi:hypothetical protein
MDIDAIIEELARDKSSVRFKRLKTIHYFGTPRIKGSHHIDATGVAQASSEKGRTGSQPVRPTDTARTGQVENLSYPFHCFRASQRDMKAPWSISSATRAKPNRIKSDKCGLCWKLFGTETSSCMAV